MNEFLYEKNIFRWSNGEIEKKYTKNYDQITFMIFLSIEIKWNSIKFAVEMRPRVYSRDAEWFKGLLK